MKVLIINEVLGTTSTGRICAQIADKYIEEGHEVKVAYGRWGDIPSEYRDIGIRIGNDISVKMHALFTRLFDRHGFGSISATRKFLKWVEEYKPDLIWMHNLHGYYINVKQLLVWLKKHPEIEKRWTLHDCWTFTGHCAYFSMCGCDKWKDQCKECIQKSTYPKSYIDGSKRNYNQKKRIFTGVENLTIITPSNWLADLVSESFLKDYRIKVEYNKVDKDVFKRAECSFRKDHNLENKKIILGVSNTWNEPRKGLDDFIKLSKLLNENYVIVLVGITEEILEKLPDNIIGVMKTNNTSELAGLYSCADIFLNLSREETFGMTTLEAISCGTKAIVYKDTACEEIVNKFGGVTVPAGNLDLLLSAIYEFS